MGRICATPHWGVELLEKVGFFWKTPWKRVEPPRKKGEPETVKIILNTKGTVDDVSPEMKRLLDYIDGQAASDEFTKELEDAVQSVRRNEK